MYRRIAAVWLSWVMVFSCVVIILDMAETVRGAVTITVDDSGGADYMTIQEGIDAASDGDTVYVYNGTYNEAIWIGKSINLIGEDRNTTLIDRMGNGDNVYIMDINWVNVTGFTISNSGAAGSDRGVRINNADNITISYNNISYNDAGIAITYSSSYINIIGNIISSNGEDGIHMYSSNNNITDNEISFNGRLGINFDSNGPYSRNNNISDNTVFSNRYGIGIYRSNESIIANNIISSNIDVGLWLYITSNNTMIGNIISSTNDIGIYLLDSNGNSIYHNNIINNVNQVSISGSSNNIWNDSNHDGNYWSDYSGLDDGSGGRTAGDGVGDTEIPHPFIDQGDGYYQLDNYPLINTTVVIDLDPPVISSGPDVTNIAHDSASIEWVTDEISDSLVEYGESTNYGFTVNNPTFLTNHKIDLTSLNPSTIYHFRVKSKDPYGNMIVSGDHTFSTNQQPKPIHNIDKDTYYDAIQEAIDDANSGNTITVNKGTYYENVIIDKSLSLFGEDRENTIINGSSGEDVVLITADGTIISNFTLIGSGLNESQAGIELKDIQNCNINNNIIFNNYQGINVSNSNNNIIFNNNISFNAVGIFFNFSVGNNIMDNAMIEDGIFMGGESIEHWNSHEIDTSNTVNGKPVHYWKNENSGTIPVNAGQIILANCRNIIIENQEITNTSVGIELGFSSDNIIRDNTISSNIIHGLFMISSNKNVITNNIISGNGISVTLTDSNENNIQDNQILDSYMGVIATISEGNTIKSNNISNNDYGIWIIGSNENIIEENIISNKEYGIWLVFSNETSIRGNKISHHFYGIYILIADRNNITENIISNNVMGLYFWINGSWNTITYNTIANNSIGIFILGFIFVNPENNFIYHNSFINNTNQSADSSINGNQWDNGYPSGGNYWDDYTGSDTKSGPNQDISGYDGIGDKPYEIIADSKDNYPLIKPWGVDFIRPTIELDSPINNSVIAPGTVISFNISDNNLDEVICSINDGPYEILDTPFKLDTTDWDDGVYIIEIQAMDTEDNINTASFNLIVDSEPPTISLDNPPEGSYLGSSPDIYLTILDEHLDEVFYSVNGGGQLPLSDPFIIHGSGWPEGEITLTIFAFDKAGNSNEKSYDFIKDVSLPEIKLISPFNESLLMDIPTIDFDITDGNLDSVSYSINQGIFQTLEAPYDIDTSDWDDGEHIVTIKAEDKAGNVKEKWYIFRKDTTSPSIQASSINDNDVNIDIETEIIIEFSESMDTESVESAISISPYSEFTCSWSNDNKTLTITCDQPMEYNTLYQVSIGTKAKDTTNQELESKYELEFTTQVKPKGKEEEFPLMYIILFLVIAIIAVVVIVALVTSKKKKAPVSGVDSELFGGVSQVPSPQTIQFTCSNCNNLLQVTDTGVAQNVTCPFCQTYLTVQSQKAQMQVSQQQIQPQVQSQVIQQQVSLQSTIQISCPKCYYKFSVVNTGGPIRVQCPNCGTTGTMG